MATSSPRVDNRPDPGDAAWGAVPPGSAALDTLEDPSIEQSPIERVMIALSESADPGARARLMLYRVVPGALGKSERVEYCEDMLPAEFEARGLSGIRDVWGPGTYEARLMGHKKGSPHFVRLAAPRFTLAPLPHGGASAPRNSDAGSGVESALRALAESQVRMSEAIAELRSAPTVSFASQMQETLGLMSSMRDAMGINHPAAAAQPQKSTIGEIVDAIKELKEVSSIVNPGGAPEKSVMEQLLEVAAPLVGMVQQALQNRQIPQHASPAPHAQLPMVRAPAQFAGDQNAVHPNDSVPPVSGGTVAEVAPNPVAEARGEAQVSSLTPPQNPQTESPSEEAILNELQSHLTALVTMAENGASVDSGANLVYDKLPDDWIELLHMNVWWDALKSAAPQVEMHEKWIRAVRDEVVRMFAEDEAEAPNQEAGAKGA